MSQDKNEDTKNNIKIPYSWKPSFLSVGFDIYQFTKNLITSKPTFAKNSRNYDLDFRGVFTIDFNKLLLDINTGLFFVKNHKTKTEHSVFLKINALWNLLRKNSNHDVFFVGMGVNVNGTKMKICEHDQNTGEIQKITDDKFCWGWLNASIGVRKTFLKWFFAGASYSFNFYKKELYTPLDRKISQERIYGLGEEKNSIAHYFSLYIGIIISLGIQDDRVKDDEYYFNLET